MLSSRCNLNMKHFQTPEYSQKIDFDDWENESRRRLWSSMSLIVDNCNLDEHWETEVLQRDGLLLKFMKLEQNKN